ncbi:thymidylate synthase [Variovorax saccharolyticus]|uniref:thymidylate synthase n=1 Tax=Variovorax saccharolyticus TaxID=3053516 RepID=UPI002576A640|nr:thymidylate synthase [Variovorax sp. J31P216]MDM0027080.1 thymidylate synthase [Variovorax sp. J31P216]
MQQSYPSFNEIYLAALKKILFRFEYSSRPRDQLEREILGFSVRLQDPRSRYCFHVGRRQNIVFNYAEALWYLSGQRDLKFIEYYAPSMANYSPDGINLPGTGYGAKLIGYGSKKLNQLDRALKILRHDDPESKRVVLQIFDADEDILKSNIDVSCTLALQLLVRAGKLHMIAFMRANDAYVGFLNDAFSFTFLQEYVASALDMPLGSYIHIVGSMHIYEKDVPRVENLLSQVNATPSLASAWTLPIMPPGCTPELIKLMLEWEGYIRRGEVSSKDIVALKQEKFWVDILLLFWIYRAIREKIEIPNELSKRIHPLHWQFILNRWSNQMKISTN